MTTTIREQQNADLVAYADLTRPRPLSEWNEEDGDVLWWTFPIEEPPYCGTPNDLGHTVELHTQDSLEPRIACRASIGGRPEERSHHPNDLSAKTKPKPPKGWR